MGTGQIDVINRAVSRLGLGRITSLTEDTKTSRAGVAAYEWVRDEVFRDHPWNCLSTRKSLPADGSDPAFGFEKAYSWPTGCLRVLEVLDGNGEPTTFPWVVEKRKILTDLSEPLPIRYIDLVEDPTVWDSMLRSAVAERLAAELALELNGNRSEREDHMIFYNRIKQRAKYADSLEQSPMDFLEDSWITLRA